MRAVILAAGKGERLYPLTLTTPKPLLPVGGKPLVDHLLCSLREVGIKEALLVVHHLADQIKAYLGDTRSGVDLRYEVQKEVLGTADALSSAELYVGDEPFLLVYGDLYVRPEAVRSVVEHGRDAAPCMATVRVRDARFYGVVGVKNKRVMRITEKPAGVKEGLVNAGIYVLDSEIFEALKAVKESPRGELELTDAVQLLIDQGKVIRCVEISEGAWAHIGWPWDLLEANKRALLTQGTDIRGDVERGAKIVGPVVVADGASILSGSYVEGPTYVGERSAIGPNCYVRPYTSVSVSVRVGNGCEIKNSIIMDGTRIAHLSYIGDSIIGRGCNLGAGTIIANLRLDDKPVKMTIRGRRVSTGTKKFGAVLGDGTKTGVNVSMMPGVKAGPNSWIGPGTVLFDDVPPNTFVRMRRQRYVTRRLPAPP